MSNHELAKRYIDKQRLIGREILDLRLLENDKVELVGVKDKDDTGRLVVPSFVTNIKMYLANGVFKGYRYSEIYIDNKVDIKFSCKYLCTGMKCEKLIVRFRHSKNIKDMSYMFSSCKAQRIDISGIDTSNVKDMSYMFGECNNLKELNISGLNLRSVKSIEGMFSGCSNINTIDIRDIDMSKVQNMQYLFEGCRGLNEVKGISDIDVRSVKDMSHIFEHCA